MNDTPDTPPRAEPDWFDWRSCLTWLGSFLSVEQLGEEIGRGKSQAQEYLSGRAEPTAEAREAALLAARRFRGAMLGAEAAAYQQALREALPYPSFMPQVFQPGTVPVLADEDDANDPPPAPASKVKAELAKLRRERKGIRR